MYSRKKVYFFFLTILLSFSFFFFSHKTYAATINLQNGKIQLNDINEEFTVDVSLGINVPDNKQYFLRGVFYKPGTENYCGYTWNGTSWFSGPYSSNEGWKQFLPVTITNNQWSGQLKAKIDTNDNGCVDTGAYEFKVQRFTTTGNSDFDTQEELSLTIVIPTSTPSPTPTSKPTVTPTPTSIPKPTATPKATTTPKPETTSTPVSTKSNTNVTITKIPTNTTVRTVNTNSTKLATRAATPILLVKTPTPTKKIEAKVLGETTENNTPQIIISIGVILLIVCAILGFRVYWEERKKHTV